MTGLVAVLPGDGIGPEVCEQAIRVLEKVVQIGGHELEIHHAAIGGQAIERHGEALPGETLELCRSVDAVLMGAVGDPRFATRQPRPEEGLLALRRELGLFVNIRPVHPYPELIGSSPIRPERLDGVDIVIVRELAGGLYYGNRRRRPDHAFDSCVYSREEIVRVARVACRLASTRSGLVTSVDKANVLETSRLWRETVTEVAHDEFPEVTLEHRLVDSMAMQLITRASDFDVIVTENMFGDILSDEAALLGGSLGMLPSASLGARRRGLYEPIHGSAPDIAGRGEANPYGAILSVAMMLRHFLGLPDAATAVEDAVVQALREGALTRDLCPSVSIDTWAAGSAVVAALNHSSGRTSGLEAQ